MKGCPFCDRYERQEFDTVYEASPPDLSVMRFEPLNPVTPGHTLFVPVTHIADASEGPAFCAAAMAAAAGYGFVMAEQFNLITSVGPRATQTVRHLHVHYVPRREDDGLHLPWTGQ